MRRALKQCLISSTIIFVVVSETILLINAQYALSVVCEGLCCTQFHTVLYISCHIVCNWILKIEFLICSKLVNLSEEVVV